MSSDMARRQTTKRVLMLTPQEEAIIEAIAALEGKSFRELLIPPAIKRIRRKYEKGEIQTAVVRYARGEIAPKYSKRKGPRAITRTPNNGD